MTDVNGLLRIDQIPLGAGRIGMTHCPGRCGTDGAGRIWARDLDADLAAVKNWGAGLLVTLIETDEFRTYGVDDLPNAVGRAGLDWRHWPVGDMKTAQGASREAMEAALPALVAQVENGGAVTIHCAAGLGRTGTFAAQLLVASGMSPEAAIRRVRAARPGTIETAAQEEAVHGWSAALSGNR